MSHSACKPLKYSLEGKTLNTAEDIYKYHVKNITHSIYAAITYQALQHVVDLLSKT
jgi:hypothetical protein